MPVGQQMAIKNSVSNDFYLRCQLLRLFSIAAYQVWIWSLVELSRNSSEGPSPFRGGSITPDGLIDEDFEEEIGQPVVCISSYRVQSLYNALGSIGIDRVIRHFVCSLTSRLSNNVHCTKVSEVMREIFRYVTHIRGHFINTWWLLSQF